MLPHQFGGPVSYVITRGNSMEPRIETGDLVLTRSQSAYAVGDVIAFHSDTFDRTFLHRIVRTSASGFVTKGDNKTVEDPDHPGPEEIFGSEWIHIQGAGTWLQRLTSPPIIAALAFLILLTVGSTAAYAGRGRRRRRRTMAGSNPGGHQPSRWSLPPHLQPFMNAALVAAGLGLLLGLFAWTRPTTISTTEDQESTKDVVFSYTAPVPPTPAYEGTEVKSPDPVFRKVANIVNVVVDYTGPPGAMAIDAKLSTSSGWRWTLPLASPQPFDQQQYRANVNLNLNDIEKQAQAGAAAAGIPASDVTVTITPTITTATGDFRPELPMQLSATEFSMTGEVDSLKVSEPTTTQVTTQEPNELSFLSFSIPVSTARLWSIILLAVGLLGAAIIAVLAAKGPAPAESELIRRRYKDLVVPVTEVPAPVGAVINVPDIGTLAKLAKRYALLILHGVQDGRDFYLIQDESTTYRYLGEQHAAQFVPQGGPPSGGDHEGLGDTDTSAPADAPSTLLVGAPPSDAPPAPRRPSRKSRRRPGKSPKNTHPAGPPLHGGAPTDAPPPVPTDGCSRGWTTRPAALRRTTVPPSGSASARRSAVPARLAPVQWPTAATPGPAPVQWPAVPAAQPAARWAAAVPTAQPAARWAAAGPTATRTGHIHGRTFLASPADQLPARPRLRRRLPRRSASPAGSSVVATASTRHRPHDGAPARAGPPAVAGLHSALGQSSDECDCAPQRHQTPPTQVDTCVTFPGRISPILAALRHTRVHLRAWGDPSYAPRPGLQPVACCHMLAGTAQREEHQDLQNRGMATEPVDERHVPIGVEHHALAAGQAFTVVGDDHRKPPEGTQTQLACHLGRVLGPDFRIGCATQSHVSPQQVTCQVLGLRFPDASLEPAQLGPSQSVSGADTEKVKRSSAGGVRPWTAPGLRPAQCPNLQRGQGERPAVSPGRELPGDCRAAHLAG